MALPATIWEVWPTSGSDNNGGGFAIGGAGTDYSKQATPQYALTGVASAGSGNTILSSAAAAAMVGNIAQVISGSNFNTGFFEVVSVSVGVSITFSTNNASQSICSGVGSSGVINIGGALATLSAMLATATLTTDMCYVKATGSYTATSAFSVTVQTNNPFRVVGYTTTRGDNGRFTWTTSTNSINLIESGSGSPSGYSFENILFTNTAGSPGDCLHAKSSNGANFKLRNCKIAGTFNVGINGNYAVDYLFGPLVVELSEITGTVSHGILNSSFTELIGVAIHNCGGDGVHMHVINNGSCLSTFNSAIKANAGYGVYIDSTAGGSLVAIKQTDIVDNGSDGIYVGASTPGVSLVVWNCIFYGNTGYRINISASGSISLFSSLCNAGGNDGTGTYHNCSLDPTDISLSADPFTNRTGTPPDLSLNSTSGGGALCRNAGTPATLPFS